MFIHPKSLGAVVFPRKKHVYLTVDRQTPTSCISLSRLGQTIRGSHKPGYLGREQDVRSSLSFLSVQVCRRPGNGFRDSRAFFGGSQLDAWAFGKHVCQCMCVRMPYACMYVCMYVCICVCMYVCTCVRTYVCKIVK